MKGRQLTFGILNFLIAALLTWLPCQVPLLGLFPLYFFCKALEVKHYVSRGEPRPMR